MKKISCISAFLLFFFFLNAMQVVAQDSKHQKENSKEAAIKALVDGRHYSFEAQTALPLGMTARQLTSGYELKIGKDTLEAYLPYFGRAYVATLGSDNNGINFKTTDFRYTATEAKKGGWNIIIQLKNAGDTRKMNMYISQSGYTTVQVTSNNKQSISFNGYIQ